ncbi:MAG: DUF839 domain-containing protein [Planctomycetes bacterium]|nr:DUF839 domain-containing protein [Planctomycetota bacterium]
MQTNRLVLAAAVATASLAAQQTFPLPNSSPSTTAVEGTAPFLIPARMTQTPIVNRDTLTLSHALPASFGNWDMIAFDPTSRHIFVPCEVGSGAGVFRYDTVTGSQATLLLGNGSGTRNPDPNTWSATSDDYARLDPATYTPNGTVLTGEETTGGRLFEIMNPLGNAPFNVRWLDKVPAMSHEGIRFDSQGNLYVIDENNSGSIYKYVPANPADLAVGQTFVLVVDAYATHPNAAPAENWNSASNQLAPRTGPATWVPITDATGNATTISNPFAYVTTTGGRDAADEVLGTPYGRPEDLDFNRLANGNECLYCCVTSEHAVLSIELTSTDTATVRVLCDRNTIDLATGAAVGSSLTSPDNLAVDAWGNVYVIEDQNPGDLWKTVDADRDGVAEGIGRLVSLGVGGSEPTGMIFDPNEPYRFVCSIQHPSSGNDALWAFHTRPYPGSDLDLTLAVGVNEVPRTGPGEFVRQAAGFDTVAFRVDSPNGTLYGMPFALMFQPFPTANGPAAFLPPLWLTPLAPMFVLVGGYAGQFPQTLPFGAASVGVTVPPGLAGVSIMAQALGVTANSSIVVTDGVEVVL